MAELGAEVAVNLDLRSLGIDQYAARVVVEKKGTCQVHPQS